MFIKSGPGVKILMRLKERKAQQCRAKPCRAVIYMGAVEVHRGNSTPQRLYNKEGGKKEGPVVMVDMG